MSFFSVAKCNKLFSLVNFDWVEKCTGKLLITILNLKVLYIVAGY